MFFRDRSPLGQAANLFEQFDAKRRGVGNRQNIRTRGKSTTDLLCRIDEQSVKDRRLTDVLHLAS